MSQQQGTTKGMGNGLSGSTLLEKLPIILRVAELCLAIIVTGLIIDPLNAHLQINPNHMGLTYVAFAGYILINAVLIIAEIVGEPVPKTPLLLFLFTGGALFLAAGSIVIHDWRHQFFLVTYAPPRLYMDMMISSGIIAILNAAIYFLDVVITIRYAWKVKKEKYGDKEVKEQTRPTGVSAEQQTDVSDFAV